MVGKGLEKIQAQKNPSPLWIKNGKQLFSGFVRNYINQAPGPVPFAPPVPDQPIDILLKA